MSVPGRIEAAALLLSLDPPPWFLRHSRAVAEIAGWLALRASRAGMEFDRRLVEAAALLHDVDKLLPADDPAAALPHGEGSAAWLARHGHPELGAAVTAHPVTRLLGKPEPDAPWFASLEERIVAYADKRAGQGIGPMESRFASWRRRYPGHDESQEFALAHARDLELEVCRAAGVKADDVCRLSWTGRALAAAHLTVPATSMPTNPRADR